MYLVDENLDKKLPTVSPNINEAKQKLAKYKYHVFLDLSNYYYQGGIKVEDSQYLATIHPFKVKIVVETRLFTADFPWKLGCK